MRSHNGSNRVLNEGSSKRFYSGPVTQHQPEVLECKVSFTTNDFRFSDRDVMWLCEAFTHCFMQLTLYRVLENAGYVRIAVRRSGDETALSVASVVDYETADGTAKAPQAYTAAKVRMYSVCDGSQAGSLWAAA